MRTFLSDLHYGLRKFRQSPALAVVCIRHLSLRSGCLTTRPEAILNDRDRRWDGLSYPLAVVGISLVALTASVIPAGRALLRASIP